jgi:hypothetical protein
MARLFCSSISSPLTTRRVTVEVFDPASTRVVLKIWELRRLVTLWTFTDCYKDGFTFSPLIPNLYTKKCPSRQSYLYWILSQNSVLFLLYIFLFVFLKFLSTIMGNIMYYCVIEVYCRWNMSCTRKMQRLTKENCACYRLFYYYYYFCD